MTISQKIHQQHDFSTQDLSGQIFTDCHFYGCSFRRADLSDSQFINCRFIEAGSTEGCDFSYANLRDASFKNCKMALINLSGINGFGLELRDCDLKGADFSRASFVNRISHKSYFCSAYITGCNLSYANFENQCIEKCDLFENRWSGANLLSASFKGSDLSRGVFSEDCWQQFSFQHCDLTHCELYGLDPRRSDLTGVKICSWQQQQLLEQLGIIIMPDGY